MENHNHDAAIVGAKRDLVDAWERRSQGILFQSCRKVTGTQMKSAEETIDGTRKGICSNIKFVPWTPRSYTKSFQSNLDDFGENMFFDFL